MRTNKGKPQGMFLAELGAWSLYQTADGRYKVAANTPTNGKANYAFGVEGPQIDTHAGLDASKLRAERPELYKSIEKFLKSSDKEVIPSETDTKAQDDADPYGDLAMSRRRLLTPEQQWRRALLSMRRIELEHTAANKETVWESGVRMAWAGIFKTRIEESDARAALAWITDHAEHVSLEAILQVEQEYYGGKLGPQSCQTLEAKLDLLAGKKEEQENELVKFTGSAGNSGAGSEAPNGSEPVSGELRYPDEFKFNGNGNLRGEDRGRDPDANVAECDPFDIFR